MMILYYIGLDIHKKMIAYCIKALETEQNRKGSGA
jgi:hypothetical protein